MKQKFFNFTIAETSGRTFDIPYDTALKLIKEIKEKDEYMTNFEIEDENDMARFFESYGLDEISKYETGNSFYETEVTDTNIYECEVIQ